MERIRARDCPIWDGQEDFTPCFRVRCVHCAFLLSSVRERSSVIRRMHGAEAAEELRQRNWHLTNSTLVCLLVRA